jgi:hypothetical protein
MAGVIRSIRQHWDLALAFVLVYAAIAVYLGPAGFFLAWFLNGCAFIIHEALRR